MVSKKSRSEVRAKKHMRVRNRISGTTKNRVLLYSEVTTICTLRLLTTRSVIL